MSTEPRTYSEDDRQRMRAAIWKERMANSGGMAQYQEGFEDAVERALEVCIEQGATPEHLEERANRARSKEIDRTVRDLDGA